MLVVTDSLQMLHKQGGKSVGGRYSIIVATLQMLAKRVSHFLCDIGIDVELFKFAIAPSMTRCRPCASRATSSNTAPGGIASKLD